MSEYSGKVGFISDYWGQIRRYQEEPTEQALEELLWFIYEEGYYDGTTRDDGDILCMEDH